MSKILAKRNVIALFILFAVVLLGIYIQTRPRVVPGQRPLTDIQNIETLRAQFNQDAGKTRLVILVSPT